MTLTLTEGNPIQGLAGELQRQLLTKRDLMADTRRVSFAAWAEGDPGLPLLVDLPDGTEEFGVTRHAHQQIADHLGIPWKLYDRLLNGTDIGRRARPAHRDLLAGLANGLLAREPDKRLVRCLDGNVRAFLSDRYRPRDNHDLLENLLPVLAGFPDVRFRRCDLTDTRMYVKISVPWIEIPITAKRGDTLQGGVIISNSEVGSGSLYIYPWSLVLDCTNGMTHEEFGQRRIHVGKRIESESEAWELYSDRTLALDDEAFFAKCADTLRGCLNESVFDAIVAQMRDLAEIRVPGPPPAAVEIISKRQGFTEKESGSILEHLIEGGDLSAWGYVNAVTATARDHEDADRAAELEMVAGRMTADPAWAAV